MKNSYATLWIIAGLLFAAVASVAVYKAWPLLYPEVAIIAPHDPQCDLRAGPCTMDFPRVGRVTFGIRPETLPLIQPLKLEVRLEGIEARGVEVDFTGLGMHMGFNRPSLRQTGEGRFSGEGVLPVCVRKAMEWEARVLIQTDEGLIAAPFRFITVKSGNLLAEGEAGGDR